MGTLIPLRRDARPLASTRNRIHSFLIVMAIIASVAAGRALYIQGVDANGAASKAASAMTNTRPLAPMRGTIYDRNGAVLAATMPAEAISADPDGISRNGVAAGQSMSASQKKKAQAAPQALAQILVDYLGGSVNTYLPHLLNTKRANGSPNQFEPIASSVPSYTWDSIQTAMQQGGWYGLFATDTPIRTYPDGTLASQVVGFVGSDGQGLEGFELYANSQLTGTPGKESYEASTYGRIPLGTDTIVPAVNGDSYHLTLDAELQKTANSELAAAVSSTGADWGTAIAMNVKTGEVLAMSTMPTYNQNSFATTSASARRDRPVTDAYEPGSVQKVLTMAALLDTGTITPDTHVVVPASVMSGGAPITDAWPHGTLYMTARGILCESSNIGMVLLTRQMDQAKLVDYWHAFGLGQPTGIQLPGENPNGMGVVPGANMPGYQRDRAAFGQSISVTALQEAAAVAGIVNGGVYNQPTIISSMTDGQGNPIPVAKAAPRRVVSEKTSADVVNMMTSVIANPAYLATRSIPGYNIAGKSGTAQRVDPVTGGYSGYTASFVLVGPVPDPQILVYVVLDNPVNGHGGTTVALPPAKDIMQFALQRYGVAPLTSVPVDNDPITYEP
ncbi:MAG: penicillin-binding protein 2 [Propionibacteriaceae bacterium]|nr:penicillin-binding protein 2 [Propionibacteriaceae bacterium]